VQVKEKIRDVLIDYSGSNLNSSAVRNKISMEIFLEISKEVANHIYYQHEELTKELLTKQNRIIALERELSNQSK
jgi:hypothetical protein